MVENRSFNVLVDLQDAYDTQEGLQCLKLFRPTLSVVVSRLTHVSLVLNTSRSPQSHFPCLVATSWD